MKHDKDTMMAEWHAGERNYIVLMPSHRFIRYSTNKAYDDQVIATGELATRRLDPIMPPYPISPS